MLRLVHAHFGIKKVVLGNSPFKKGGGMSLTAKQWVFRYNNQLTTLLDVRVKVRTGINVLQKIGLYKFF
jgi:hypothetical protein